MITKASILYYVESKYHIYLKINNFVYTIGRIFSQLTLHQSFSCYITNQYSNSFSKPVNKIC